MPRKKTKNTDQVASTIKKPVLKATKISSTKKPAKSTGTPTRSSTAKKSVPTTKKPAQPAAPTKAKSAVKLTAKTTTKSVAAKKQSSTATRANKKVAKQTATLTAHSSSSPPKNTTVPQDTNTPNPNGISKKTSAGNDKPIKTSAPSLKPKIKTAGSAVTDSTSKDALVICLATLTYLLFTFIRYYRLNGLDEIYIYIVLDGISGLVGGILGATSSIKLLHAYSSYCERHRKEQTKNRAMISLAILIVLIGIAMYSTFYLFKILYFNSQIVIFIPVFPFAFFAGLLAGLFTSRLGTVLGGLIGGFIIIILSAISLDFYTSNYITYSIVTSAKILTVDYFGILIYVLILVARVLVQSKNNFVKLNNMNYVLAGLLAGPMVAFVNYILLIPFMIP